MRYRRGRYNDYRSSDDYNKIILTEFKFYNKKKKVIDEDKLKEIEDKFAPSIKLLQDFTKTEKAKENNYTDIKNIDSSYDIITIRDLIKKPLMNKLYWTNKEFAKYNIGFVFCLRKGTIYIEILNFSSSENKVKIKAEEFCKTKYIFRRKFFFNFDLTEKQLELLEEKIFEYDNMHLSNSRTFDNWDEVIEHITTSKILDKYHIEYDDNFKKHMKILFDLDIDIVKLKKKYSYIHDTHRCNIFNIFHVIEKRYNEKNYRIALISKFYYRDLEYELKVFSEDDKEYNHIDVERIFFKNGGYRAEKSKLYFLDLAVNYYDNGKLVLDADIINEMNNNINELLRDDECIITPRIFQFYKKRNFLGGSDFLTERDKKIIEQYQKLLKEGRTIKMGDTFISQTEIKIEGQSFDIKFDKKFLNTSRDLFLIRKALNISEARYNFNIVYENLLKISRLKIIDMNDVREEEYKHFNFIKFEVNDIKIKVEKINSRMRINDIACRIADVNYILSKVICYNTQEEFDKYVKDVSFIGVEWKKMICDGVLLNLNNPFHDIFKKTGETRLENMYLRFSLLWDAEKRSQVYLMLNGQKYLIKYKGKFKRYFNYPKRVLSIEKLGIELKDCIQNIDEEKILEIIDNAIEEAKIIQKRGKELVANTVKDIQAIKTTIEIRGQKINGYKFKGRLTKSDYFIQEIDLDVYKFMNGQWNRRCVVDDHTKQRIFEDRLANRLVNIYNEPKKIYTLH